MRGLIRSAEPTVPLQEDGFLSWKTFAARRGALNGLGTSDGLQRLHVINHCRSADWSTVRDFTAKWYQVKTDISPKAVQTLQIK
jgi:hypothetical protein